VIGFRHVREGHVVSVGNSPRKENVVPVASPKIMDEREKKRRGDPRGEESGTTILPQTT